VVYVRGAPKARLAKKKVPVIKILLYCHGEVIKALLYCHGESNLQTVDIKTKWCSRS